MYRVVNDLITLPHRVESGGTMTAATLGGKSVEHGIFAGLGRDDQNDPDDRNAGESEHRQPS